jgi:hypothetical protein
LHDVVEPSPCLVIVCWHMHVFLLYLTRPASTCTTAVVPPFRCAMWWSPPASLVTQRWHRALQCMPFFLYLTLPSLKCTLLLLPPFRCAMWWSPPASLVTLFLAHACLSPDLSDSTCSEPHFCCCSCLC